VANIYCSFKAGKIHVEESRRISQPRRLGLLGNGWRGTLIMTGALLCIYGLWELGLIAMALAVIWSVIEILIKKGKTIFTRQKVLQYLRQGKEEDALALVGEPEPLSLIWWQYLVMLFKQGRWAEACSSLQGLEAGKERDYLLALTYLGQNQPEAALGLCPPRPEGHWQMVRVQALFQMGEWQKVLGVLRRKSGKVGAVERREMAWLKGGSYYHMEQYKPAVKLLREVVEYDDPDYSIAENWLDQALAKLG